MTLNCIWYWGSTFGALGIVDNPLLQLLPGPLRPGVVVPLKVPCVSQKDLFENYLYLMGRFENKNLLRNNWAKKNIWMDGIP